MATKLRGSTYTPAKPSPAFARLDRLKDDMFWDATKRIARANESSLDEDVLVSKGMTREEAKRINERFDRLLLHEWKDSQGTPMAEKTGKLNRNPFPTDKR